MKTTSILVRKRLTLVLLLAGLALVALMVRLAWIQFVMGEDLKNKALEVRMRDIPVEAKRGTIYDRNGKELVTSVSVDSVYAIPHQVENKRDAAERLAPILGMDVERLTKTLSKKSSFEWIKRKLEPDVSNRIKSLNLQGIHIVEESKRYYLHDTLAPHVLGFTGVDNQGLMGIEKTYDKELKGEPGRIVVEHDATGRKVPEAMHQYYQPTQGNSLVLTLDETIQYFVERELDKVVTKYRPKLAVIIVMDPKTGEILAMGNRPTFNSNDWKNVPRNVWDRNPAIWYNYEPGSTFKIITTSAGIQENVVKPSDKFFDPGFIKVADRRIRCWKGGGHGSQTFEEVVMNSCNPGFIEVGLGLGKERFYKYLKAFGFGNTTGIDLPGEAKGIMIPEKSATNLNIATMSIGQSIAVTPIQLLTAASAVANNGEMLRPHLVKEMRDHTGKVIKEFKPESMGQVIEPESARQVSTLLENVVAKGTGSKAFVEGYRVAGKTGTAQVVGEHGGYVSGRYVASFTGFAPVDNPRIAVLVMVAEPQGGIYYGGQVAAPIFQAVAGDILHYLRVPETPGLEKPKEPYEIDVPRQLVMVPNVINYPVQEAVKALREQGLAFQTSGDGSIVYGQTPRGGAQVYSDTKIILDLQPPPGEQEAGDVTVPNLNGLTVREAGNLLEDMGLHLEPMGSGLVSKQIPDAGNKVKKGAIVRVEFSPPGQNLSQTPEEDAPPVMSSEIYGEFVGHP